MHSARHEVIIDVVLITTAEKDNSCPTISWRGGVETRFSYAEKDNPPLP